VPALQQRYCNDGMGFARDLDYIYADMRMGFGVRGLRRRQQGRL